MKKAAKTVIVGIVEKPMFKYRIVEGNAELGAYLYDFLLALLKASGKEIKGGSNRIDVGLFTQIDSTHKIRCFEVPEKIAIVLDQYCRFEMRERLEKFSKECQKKGTNLLLMLNSGEMSLSDFNDTLK